MSILSTSYLQHCILQQLDALHDLISGIWNMEYVQAGMHTPVVCVFDVVVDEVDTERSSVCRTLGKCRVNAHAYAIIEMAYKRSRKNEHKQTTAYKYTITLWRQIRTERGYRLICG